MIYDRRPKSSGFRFSELPKEAYGVAVLMLALMFVFLLLSHPSDAKMRLVALEHQAAAIKAADVAKGDLRAYPLGSVCSGELNDNIKNQLKTALMNSGLKVDALDISARGQVEGQHPLMVYGVTLKGSGSYEQALNTMAVMSHYRPRLFLDSMSLRNQTTAVDLDVEGRLYCRWTKQN